MKICDTLNYCGTTLNVLVTFSENDVVDFEGYQKPKAYIEYFVNGVQLEDWHKIKLNLQCALSMMADNVCRENNLYKWSY